MKQRETLKAIYMSHFNQECLITLPRKC